MIPLSVVIPAYNEEHNITACLQALTQQNTRRPFEVILVDNASTDTTATVAKKIKDTLTLRIIREERKGRGRARNTGYRHAKGAIIFSTDADATVPPEWIETYAAYLEAHPDVVAVTGPPHIIDCTPWKNGVFNTVVPLFLRINRVLFFHEGLSGFSLAVRRTAYDACGGFDPEADAYEDIELARRLHHHGKIVFLSSMPVTFSARRFQDGLLKGWYVYVKIFFQKFIFRHNRVDLEVLH